MIPARMTVVILATMTIVDVAGEDADATTTIVEVDATTTVVDTVTMTEVIVTVIGIVGTVDMVAVVAVTMIEATEVVNEVVEDMMTEGIECARLPLPMEKNSLRYHA